MMVHVLEVENLGAFRLRLHFDDGSEGVVNLLEVVPFRGVFASLNDPEFFERVEVDRDWGGLRWPGDLDLAPEPLYEKVTGRDPLAAWPLASDGSPGG